MRRLSLTAILLLALAPATLAAGPEVEYGYEPVPVGTSAPPTSVRSLLFARPFTLTTPYTYEWTAEKAKITSGYMLVIEVDPEYAVILDAWYPILYVGRYPAEIVDNDEAAGRMIVVVPGDVDLTQDPIFFGSVELPERITAERGRQEMAAAQAAGFRPMTAELVRMALQAGGERAMLSDSHALYSGPLADMIDHYVPAHDERAAGMRVPRLGTR
jgi:hypothetical protein